MTAPPVEVDAFEELAKLEQVPTVWLTEMFGPSDYDWREDGTLKPNTSAMIKSPFAQHHLDFWNYVARINEGETVESANTTANFMFSKYDTFDNDLYIDMAKNYSQIQYGGKQLPVIAEAHAKGYTG